MNQAGGGNSRKGLSSDGLVQNSLMTVFKQLIKTAAFYTGNCTTHCLFTTSKFHEAIATAHSITMGNTIFFTCTHVYRSNLNSKLCTVCGVNATSILCSSPYLFVLHATSCIHFIYFYTCLRHYVVYFTRHCIMLKDMYGGGRCILNCFMPSPLPCYLTYAVLLSLHLQRHHIGSCQVETTR